MAEKKINMSSPITSLPGVGAKRAELFGALGVSSVGDLLRLFLRNGTLVTAGSQNTSQHNTDHNQSKNTFFHRKNLQLFFVYYNRIPKKNKP